MSRRGKRLIWTLALGSAGLAVCLLALYPTVAADAKPEPLKSQVVGWDAARSRLADWGEMRTYFTGETSATKHVLTAVAVV